MDRLIKLNRKYLFLIGLIFPILAFSNPFEVNIELSEMDKYRQYIEVAPSKIELTDVNGKVPNDNKLDKKRNFTIEGPSVKVTTARNSKGNYIIVNAKKQGRAELLIYDIENKVHTIVKFRIKKSYLNDVTNEIIFWGAIVLIGIAVFSMANIIFVEDSQFRASEQIESASAKQSDHRNIGFILRASKPFFKRYFVPVVSGMKNKAKFRAKYRQPLASAGLQDEMNPEEFYAFKLFLILAFPIVYIALRWFMETEGEEPWPMKFIPFLAVMGFVYPDIWIKQKIKKRQNEILLKMPFFVDLLALCVEAGKDTVEAIAKVAEKSPDCALKDEFEMVVKEIKIGSSRSEALRNMSWRIDLLQMSSFCATLIAADSVGAAIPPILKSLSKEIRQKRSSEIEKQGAKAATKVLFPTISFIIPAVLIIVFTPLLLDAFFS